MGLIRKFFADTRDMVLDGLAAVGLLRGGAAWWRERMRRRAEVFEGRRENLRRSVAASHRMCRECRTLVDVHERTCPACGASMHGIPKGGAGRLLHLLAPSFGSASTSLLGMMLVVYSVAALTAPGGPALFSIPGTWLFRLGSMHPVALFQLGEWWRLVNPIFLHAGVLHILFNGYALANIGPAIEAAIGSRRFFVLFIATGVLSFVASAVVSRGQSVGASGAIFGLIGFGVVHGRMRGGMFRDFSDDLLRWAGFGLVMSLMPGIDLAAHAGGFVSGALFGLVVARRPPRHAWLDTAWTIALLLAIALPVVGFVMALTRGS